MEYSLTFTYFDGRVCKQDLRGDPNTYFDYITSDPNVQSASLTEAKVIREFKREYGK